MAGSGEQRVPTGQVSKAITAENQFTAGIRMKNGGSWIIKNTDAINATFTIQTRADGDPTGWVDVSGDDASVVLDAASATKDVSGAGNWFRAGVKTGDYTSGEATVYLKSREL